MWSGGRGRGRRGRHPQAPLASQTSSRGEQNRQSCSSTAKFCMGKMKGSLGAQGIALHYAVLEYGLWGGGKKSCHGCCRNQTHPQAHHSPASHLCSNQGLHGFEALGTEMKTDRAAVAFKQPSWQYMFRSFPEKCQRHSVIVYCYRNVHISPPPLPPESDEGKKNHV